VARVEVRLEHAARGGDEFSKRLVPIEQFPIRRHPPCAYLFERGDQQVVDRPEMVKDQRLVAPGPLRDPPGTRAGKPGLTQHGDGRLNQRGTSIAHSPPPHFERSLKAFA
jgi:hypothetical protein